MRHVQDGRAGQGRGETPFFEYARSSSIPFLLNTGSSGDGGERVAVGRREGGAREPQGGLPQGSRRSALNSTVVQFFPASLSV